MRARVPPRSDGLLNGHYDKKHGGKQARTGKTVVNLVTIFFVCAWLMLVCKHYNVDSYGLAGRLPGSSGGQSSALPGAAGLDRRGAAAGPEDRSSRHSRHKKRHKKGVCTDSPLQEQEAFPEYGCYELEVREGKERGRGGGSKERGANGWCRCCGFRVLWSASFPIQNRVVPRGEQP